jgi:sec-independent protein translocase protein TatA
MGLDNPVHVLLVLVVILMLFGAKRLPELGRSLGASMRGFKEGINPGTEQPSITQTSEAAPLAAEPVREPVGAGTPEQKD